MIRDLAYANRTCRRFVESGRISRDDLMALADLARVTASAGNLQPLKYLLVHEEADCVRMFPLLGWAAYLSGWKGPAEGERPAAYIVILCDTSISANPGCDHGIAAQTILLGAREKGLAGAMIGAVNAKGLAKAFSLPDHLNVLLVLALGWPLEEVVLEPMGADGDIRYWRDDAGVHHVPKRSLEEVVLPAPAPLPEA
ncbi:MAG: nitroreductase family protein [Proteobacteria bacterium]|nr:nitroreductase family protein [Pseudomonadota bacterium]